MAAANEKIIERKLRQEVERRGGLCIKLWSNSFTGLPDRLCLLPGGALLFVEVKSTGEKPRKIQELVHRKLRRLGFMVAVLDKETDINQLV